MLSGKFVSGLEAYAALWPGKVIGWVKVAEAGDDSLDLMEHDPATSSVEIHARPEAIDSGVAQALAGMSVVLLNDDQYGMALAKECGKAGVPYVHNLEWDPVTRRQILWRDAESVIRGAKRVLWAELGAGARVRSIKAAAGVQCNGTPTYDEFGPSSARPLLYFDSRVSAEMTVDAAVLDQRLAEMERGGPLRLVFSGRLIPIKGADHLPVLADALVKRKVPFTFDICGSGALEDEIRKQVIALGLEDRVRLRGTLDFHRELIPFVSQKTDLFVCCHTQGDPSCTYLETMACGVPIVGYPNLSLDGFVRRDPLGWTSPAFNAHGLADVIARLDQDRPAIARASRVARAFSLKHTFSNTMQMRVQHLLACAGVAGQAQVSLS